MQLCDAARRLVERAGRWTSTNVGPVHTFDGSGFSVSFHTPFQRFPINKELVKRGFASEQAQREYNGLYGIDVWWRPEGKVLNVIWNDPEGARTVVSFRRGEWEELFLRIDP